MAYLLARGWRLRVQTGPATGKRTNPASWRLSPSLPWLRADHRMEAKIPSARGNKFLLESELAWTAGSTSPLVLLSGELTTCSIDIATACIADGRRNAVGAEALDKVLFNALT